MEIPREAVPENARAAGWYDDVARRARESGCIFCPPKDKYIVTRDSDWFLTTNKFSRSQANLMVVPNRHIEHFHELTPEDAVVRQRLEHLGLSLINECFGITEAWFILREGLNGSAAVGKTVDHLHSHVLQYYHGILVWESDRNNPDRRPRTPEEAGWPIIPAIEASHTLREALTRRRQS